MNKANEKGGKREPLRRLANAVEAAKARAEESPASPAGQDNHGHRARPDFDYLLTLAVPILLFAIAIVLVLLSGSISGR